MHDFADRRPSSLTLLAATAILCAQPSCFSPNYGNTAFRCEQDRCPEGYTCQGPSGARYCVRNGVKPGGEAGVDRPIGEDVAVPPIGDASRDRAPRRERLVSESRPRDVPRSEKTKSDVPQTPDYLFKPDISQPDILAPDSCKPSCPSCRTTAVSDGCGGTCAANCTTSCCVGVCCASGEVCNAGACCAPYWDCTGKCGLVTNHCGGTANCGGCPCGGTCTANLCPSCGGVHAPCCQDSVCCSGACRPSDSKCCVPSGKSCEYGGAPAPGRCCSLSCNDSVTMLCD